MENNNLKLDDGTVLDPKVLKVVRALRTVESGGSKDPYNQYGDNGKSLGAYQWNNGQMPLAKGELPVNWKSDAQQFLGDANAPMTPGNQNKTMYLKVKARKDAGMMPDEIAALHNGAKKGKNGRYEYVNPEYGQKFRNALGSSTSSGVIESAQPALEQPQSTKFDVPGMSRTPEQQAIRQENARQAMVDSQLEARKANNPFKILKDTILGIPKTMFNMPAALGKTLGESLAAPKVADDIEQANQLQGDSQFRMLKEIQRVEQGGGDATRLKQIFNQQKNTESVADIAPSINKSNSQVMGEIGGTAIDLLTAGYGSKLLPKGMTGKLATKAGTLLDRTGLGAVSPELSAIASQQAKGLFTKQGIGNVLEGASLGYASDVAQGLGGGRGEDSMGKAAFAPGLGTLLGAGIPAIAETSQSFKNKLNIDNQIDELHDSWNELYSGTKRRAKKMAQADRVTELKNRYTTGRTPTRVLAEDGVIPKIKDTGFDTVEQAEKYRDSISPLNDANKAALTELDKTGAVIDLNQAEQKAIAAVLTQKNIDSGDADGLVNEVTSAFKSLREWHGNEIPLSKADGIKTARAGKVAFDSTRPFKKTGNYEVSKALRLAIEDKARSLGAEDVAQLNREIGDKLDAVKFLEDIHGERAKGGRLGKYVGAMIGSTLGSTPLGKILGAFGGDMFANLLISNSVAGPVKRLLLKDLQRKNPQAYTKTIQWLKSRKLGSDILLGLPEGGKSSYKPVDSKVFVNPQGQASDSLQEVVDANSPAVSSRLDSPNMSNEVALNAINDERTLAETAGAPDAINAPDIKDDLNFLDKSDDIARREEEIAAMQGADDFASQEEKAAAKKLFDLKNRLKEKEILDGDVQGYKNGKVDQRAANRNALVENYASARGEAGMGANFDNNAQYANQAADKYGAAKEKKKSIFQQMKEIAQQKKLLKEEEKRLKNMGKSAGAQMLAGGVGATAGIETDEDGNITGYNMEKGIRGGIAGLGGAVAIGSIKGIKPFTYSAKDELVSLLQKTIKTNPPPQANRLMAKVEKGIATNSDFEMISNIVKASGQKVPLLGRIKNKAPLKDSQDLLVMHNISSGGILNAKRIGGLPSPSIGIAHKDFPFTQFGEITLIADKNLIDPVRSKNSKVFNADVYSARYPQTQDKLNENEALDSLIRSAESTGYHNKIGGLWDGVKPKDVINSIVRDEGVVGLKYSPPFKAAYLKEKGMPIDGDVRRIDIDINDYENWYYNKLDELDFDQKIFKGFSPSGNRKYVEANINEIVKEMGKDARSVEGMNYGVPSIRGASAKKYKDIESIKKDKGKLVSSVDMEKIKEDTNKEFEDLVGEDLSMHQVSSNLVDLMKNKISKDDFMQYTGADEIQTEEFLKFAKKLKELPSEYFEAKVIRPVGLQEFNSAIVPKGTSQKIIQHLKEKGIDIIEYSDAADRARKIKEQAAVKNVLFSLAAGATIATGSALNDDK